MFYVYIFIFTYSDTEKCLKIILYSFQIIMFMYIFFCFRVFQSLVQ